MTRPDPRAEPDEPIPDTERSPAMPTILPPPRPSSGPRTRPSSPSALRVADILAEARRSAGLDDSTEAP